MGMGFRIPTLIFKSVFPFIIHYGHDVFSFLISIVVLIIRKPVAVVDLIMWGSSGVAYLTLVELKRRYSDS